MKPSVSIVIPCYKQAQYLAEAIESALAQTWNPTEVIVVNDGSPDNASDVARCYPMRLIEKPNGGVSSARNVGIAATSGEWIMCLDADDRIDRRCIEKCVGLADVVCPGQQEFEGGQQFHFRSSVDFSLRSFLKANRIHCASLFRRSSWERIGGYDEEITWGLEDWDFWIRLVAAGARVVAVDEPLFFYRVHPSMNQTVTKPNFREYERRMRQKHADLYRRCKVA